MRAASGRACSDCYGGSAGASATINREPGQARKGAAAAVDLCAGVLLVEPPPISLFARTERQFYKPVYVLLSACYCRPDPVAGRRG